MASDTMRAIRVYQYGGPEQLTLERIARPATAPGELLVRIYAAGVLPIDTAIRGGRFPGVVPKAFPYIPGTAFAGVVAALGEGVTNVQLGQAICGRIPRGTYAEYATVRADAPAPASQSAGYEAAALISPLAPKPATLSFDEAATLSGGATTAWTALFEDGELQPGQRVLIHGGAGGVGLFAVQFARWKGAHVIATASAANLAFVRELGAHEAIDYAASRFEDAAQDIDLVLDSIGGETLQRSMRIIRPGGALVSIVETPPAALAEERGIRAVKNAALPGSVHLRTIGALIDAGHVRPVVRQAFALEDAPRAHALAQGGHGRGRVVLQIADQ